MDSTNENAPGARGEGTSISNTAPILPNKFGFVNKHTHAAERGAAYLDKIIERNGRKYSAAETEAYCEAELKKLSEPNPHEHERSNATKVVIATPPIASKKVFPSYGRQIAEMRQSGRIPRSVVHVVSDWNLAQKCTRIVLDKSVPIQFYRFDYLAGLPVQVCCGPVESKRVSELITELKAINPLWLATFCPDLVDTNWPARCILVNNLPSHQEEVVA